MSTMETTTPEAITASRQEAFELGVEAFLYFYPLVTMDVTRRQMTNLEPGKRPGFAPMNNFSHIRAFPDAAFRTVVRPNFDTLYSFAWLDLTIEPVIVSAPDTHGRYYLLQMLDMWTDTFAVPGKRTSGTGVQHYAVIGPGWVGPLPPGVEKIQAPTPYVMLVGRTQTNGPADYDAVHRIQDGYTLTPLSQWGLVPQRVPFRPDPTVDMRTEPLQQVNGMPVADFFGYAAELLKLHAPHVTDWSILRRMRRIGIEVGQSFAFDQLPPAVREALADVPAQTLAKMRGKAATLGGNVNGWSILTDTVGVYGDSYLKRACVAMIGLGANQPEDAIYPLNVADADGVPLTGEHDYLLHFAKDDLPPVDAFWSVTIYDAEGFQVANPLDRFAIGARDALSYGEDGSLDLYLQRDSPGARLESNWLPAPQGPLGVTMRLYAPKAAALDGTWRPPAIRRAR
ncbi:MAG TPA: DUF1254 domain-containing protein [Thermomicrobiaceae bacterium]|nr:DUF1254 domain-containing protein [Thermomicrobiaceae bacterium]